VSLKIKQQSVFSYNLFKTPDYLLKDKSPMPCFFLRLTNTLKQPDPLHFITSGLHQIVKQSHHCLDKQNKFFMKYSGYFEAFEKCSILFNFKKDDDFNHRHTF